jgi:hypothetical protein
MPQGIAKTDFGHKRKSSSFLLLTKVEVMLIQVLFTPHLDHSTSVFLVLLTVQLVSLIFLPQATKVVFLK